MQIQSIMETTMHEQQTRMYDLRYCAVVLVEWSYWQLTASTALLKCTEIIQIKTLRHLCTNNLFGVFELQFYFSYSYNKNSVQQEVAV